MPKRAFPPKKACKGGFGKPHWTKRGFEIVEFSDCYGQECSIQQSSRAEFTQPGISAIWLGVDINLRGEEVGERMHLRVKDVRRLIAHLEAWIRSGSLSPACRKTIERVDEEGRTV